MRKVLITYFLASFLLVFLTMVLSTCGGDGGGGLNSSEEFLPDSPPVTSPGITIEMLGLGWFKEYTDAGGVYESDFLHFGGWGFLWQYHNENYDTSDLNTGGWDIDGFWDIDNDKVVADGNLEITIGGQRTSTMRLISYSPTEVEVWIDDGTGTPSTTTFERIVPVDPAKLPGTYVDSTDGYTWVFNPDGTGFVSGYGGLTFTWSVDYTGHLQMPADTGYTAMFHARASSQSTATTYTVLKVAITEHVTSTDGYLGNFKFYYGGRELTRQ